MGTPVGQGLKNSRLARWGSIAARRRFLKSLQWVVVATLFVLMGRMVWNNWVQVREASFTFDPLSLLLSTILFAFSYFIQFWAWYLITVRLGIAISLRETVKSWFYSQLGKYLPGKVWILLGRFYLYGSKGKSKKVISVALYFEAVIGVVAGGTLFLTALLFLEESRSISSGKEPAWLILPFALAVVFLYPRVLEKMFNLVLRLFRREPVTIALSYRDILWILLISLLAWIVGGLGFYVFVNGIFTVPSTRVLFLTGALAFSCFLGLMAVFAPSGLGVREGALVYLLSAIMPASVAVIVSILTRIWMTLIEIGLIGMIYLEDLFRQRDKKGSSHG